MSDRDKDVEILVLRHQLGVLQRQLGTARPALTAADRAYASAVKNPADASGRGWAVTSKWATHQVAVSFLSDASTPSRSPVYLTTDTSDDHVDARIAPYGAHDYLVSWETVREPGVRRRRGPAGRVDRLGRADRLGVGGRRGDHRRPDSGGAAPLNRRPPLGHWTN